MYETLLIEANESDIEVIEKPMSIRNKGFCIDGVIIINSKIDTSSEKHCILAEELGHCYTTVGDIIDQTKTQNRKQEEIARRWAVRKIASLKGFIAAYEAGCRTKDELVEHMNITDEFLLWSLDYYKRKYGLMTVVDKQYVVYFEPFGIMKLFDAQSHTE